MLHTWWTNTETTSLVVMSEYFTNNNRIDHSSGAYEIYECFLSTKTFQEKRVEFSYVIVKTLAVLDRYLFKNQQIRYDERHILSPRCTELLFSSLVIVYFRVNALKQAGLELSTSNIHELVIVLQSIYVKSFFVFGLRFESISNFVWFYRHISLQECLGFFHSIVRRQYNLKLQPHSFVIF